MLSFREIASQVWVYPHEDNDQRVQPCVGAIVGAQQTILVDAGNGPHHAWSIINGLNAIGAPPITTVIYTHHHWDHVFGASTYQAHHIVAHELCAARLKPMTSRAWNPAAVREEAYRNPHLEHQSHAILRAVDDWRGFRVCLPTITFSKKLCLYLDDTLVELEHVGGPHAEDSLVVRLPHARVMFVGDAIYGPSLSERAHHDDNQSDTTLIRRLQAENYTYYVHGHGDILSAQDLEQYLY